VATATLSTRLDDFIYARLSAVASGRRYVDDTAPTNVTFPYVQYSLLSGQQIAVLEGARIMGEYVYLVQAIGRTGTYDDVEAPSDQIYAALHRVTGSVAGLLVLSSVCEEEVRRAETKDGGVRYRYLGWRCRFQTQSDT
jgi:hypothetical protein